MASITSTTVSTVVEVPGVVLTLTEDEATTLMAILVRISGADAGYRGHAQGILNAISQESHELYERGLDRADAHVEGEGYMQGTLYFDNARD